MPTLPKINIKVGDTVIVKYGDALGLGKVLAINTIDYKDSYGQALVSWRSIGLRTHQHTSLQAVDPSKLSCL